MVPSSSLQLSRCFQRTLQHRTWLVRTPGCTLSEVRVLPHRWNSRIQMLRAVFVLSLHPQGMYHFTEHLQCILPTLETTEERLVSSPDKRKIRHRYGPRKMPWKRKTEIGLKLLWTKGYGRLPANYRTLGERHGRSPSWPQKEPTLAPLWFHTSNLRPSETTHFSYTIQFVVLCYGSSNKLIHTVWWWSAAAVGPGPLHPKLIPAPDKLCHRVVGLSRSIDTKHLKQYSAYSSCLLRFKTLLTGYYSLHMYL